MRFAATWLLFLGVVGAGCDNGKMHLHPESGPDVPDVRWWQPKPGETRDWDMQIRAPFDVSAERSMYVLDLWSLVPSATMLDYGDGAPVTVPAGALAGKIAELHARANRPVVICHVAMGAIRLSDPDAMKFPGYAASPPDRPDPPAAGSLIGYSTLDTLEPDERFVDLRTASRATLSALMEKRLDLAKMIGCDGVEPDKVHNAQSDPGWTISPTEQTSWFTDIAREAHERELSVGMKNGHTLAGQVDTLASRFDWMMIERCGEYQDCDQVRPFINLRHAVFAIDYTTDIDGLPQTSNGLCQEQTLAMIQDGIIKDPALSSASRQQCVP